MYYFNTIKILLSSSLLIVVLGMLIPSAMNLFAAEDQLITRLAVLGAGGDTTPPSVPLNVVATNIASTQIDIAWGASTDNIGVTGYEVFRESVFIATTTSLFYIDSSLTPETTYTYTVRAVDAAGNYSSFSSNLVVTTLAGLDEVYETETSKNANTRKPLFLNVEARLAIDSVQLTWLTNILTTSSVRWGTTKDYELGFLEGGVFLTQHGTKLADLTPDTQYFFEIYAQSQSGIYVRTEGSFHTLTLSDTQAPVAPAWFLAKGLKDSIHLSWQNPPEKDFESVRIMRSDIFPPIDIYDGKLVYEGIREGIIDSNVEKGVRYYYTIFARDKSGNWSNGVVATAIIGRSGEETKPESPFEGIVDLPANEVDPIIRNISLFDFDFFQEGRELSQINGRVNIDATKALTVSIDYEKVPEILKTIAITLFDAEDQNKAFTFLLRTNDEKTKYVATIAPLGRSGSYALAAVVVDYKNRGLKRIYGELVATAAGLEKTNVSRLSEIYIFFSIILFSLLFLLILLLLVRRRKEYKKIQSPGTVQKV